VQTQYSVYGAVIVTIVIEKVYQVHLTNAYWVPGGCRPSDQENQLGLWVRL